ncbi:class I SAM-dependent methyltransferase [Paraburkholderia sp. IMGN_8]|uniref:class I SAM-dependent methyltransferase n=1 Tax=Paraburkholderia sp. IMGN_8 TaxID=3136564 RepID=UPI003100FA00
MAYTHTNFPALDRKHILGAELFANRADMVARLGTVGGVIAELGVAAGDFSQFMMDKLQPKKFVAIDLFDMHKYPVIWGKPSTELFENKTQLEYFRMRFASKMDRIATEEGPSYDMLDKYPDGFFDLIYVDAGHDYESVKRDAEVSARKVKKSGTIVFNDYVLYDPFGEGPYGVVQAVNELVTAGPWRVAGFALEKNMFCDIAVKRANV